MYFFYKKFIPSQKSKKLALKWKHERIQFK